ncbi:YopX family protein [Streptococcus infantis]|uniref:YopX family protein n=1 Tax=Streptococcus infantis TaxID=68892 RepID=UPI0039C25C09
MIQKFRAWHKTWEEMGKVKRIRFDGEGNITTVFVVSETSGSNAYLKDVELMQSTGLFDRNGKDIFEGDIISDGHTSRDICHHQTLGFYTIDSNGVEEFFGDTASLEDFEEVSKYMSANIEIIGNIYENPELLEDKKWN